MSEESRNQGWEAKIRERTSKLYQPILARPEVPDQSMSKQERSPDKSYDNLSAKVPHSLKVEFLTIAATRKVSPSRLAKEIIEEFVKKNRSAESASGSV